MTPEMRLASKRALKNYLDTLPPKVKEEMPKGHYGIKIATNLKHDLRYIAAVKAAPELIDDGQS